MTNSYIKQIWDEITAKSGNLVFYISEDKSHFHGATESKSLSCQVKFN